MAVVQTEGSRGGRRPWFSAVSAVSASEETEHRELLVGRDRGSSQRSDMQRSLSPMRVASLDGHLGR